MWELERDNPAPEAGCPSLTIVGRGRMGNALASALRQAGVRVDGPLARGEYGNPQHPFGEPRQPRVVLLCVPDAEIGSAAAAIPRGALVGHCSGASRLDVLAPHEAFSVHPLMTVTSRGANFAGAGAAIAGSTPRAEAVARRLAESLGMRTFRVAEADRAAYHAAASIASNFLVTLEGAAEHLALQVGVERELLLPLVRATVENWGELGASRALTGPVARGDARTVAEQRAAVVERAPELVSLFDALVRATAELAAPASPPPRQEAAA